MQIEKEDIVYKKDALRIIRKRMRDLLKPYGFVQHPKRKNLLCRVREDFVDCMSLRTDG